MQCWNFGAIYKTSKYFNAYNIQLLFTKKTISSVIEKYISRIFSS
ncbi:hypothetical protein [Enterococcus faecalis]|nr:hypothetical protein [Enterococcus faecalis]